MRMRPVLILGTVILATVALVPVLADEEARPFTSAELDRFLDDWPGFVKWAEARGRDLEVVTTPSEMLQAFQRFDAGVYLRDAGWDPERFFYVAGHSWMATVVISAQAQVPEMIAGIDEAIDAIRSNQMLTNQQKQATIDELVNAKALMLGLDSYFDIDPTEVELVRSRQDRVRKVLELD
jgi:hypothetical protein